MHDLTTDRELTNAVSLSTGVATVTRTLGPAIAGLLIVSVGIVWCFAINAVSYVAVLASLFLLDRTTFREWTPISRERAQVREGLRYCMSRRSLKITLFLVAIMGIFAWNWHSILPVYATTAFQSDASLFGLMTSAVGVGSLLGAMGTARLRKVTGFHLMRAGLLCSGALLILAIARTTQIAMIGLALLGVAGTAFGVRAVARLQLMVTSEMMGRVMALYSIAWAGSRPIGGLIAGLVQDWAGPRVAFLLGASVTILSLSVVALLGPGEVRRRRGESILSG